MSTMDELIQELLKENAIMKMALDKISKMEEGTCARTTVWAMHELAEHALIKLEDKE